MLIKFQKCVIIDYILFEYRYILIHNLTVMGTTDVNLYARI